MKTRYGGGTPELIAQKNIQIKSLLSEIETLKRLLSMSEDGCKECLDEVRRLEKINSEMVKLINGLPDKTK